MERTKKAILIVDDDPKMLKLLSLRLTQNGYRVITAQSGSDALDTLKLEKPGLVLLDMLMPDMNGLDVLKKIKNLQPDIPVAIVTSVWDEAEAERAFEAGAYEYVTKPVDMEHLERVVLVKLFPEE